MAEPRRGRSLGVVVLGMHGSGTSLLAGTLHRLGLEFGGLVPETEPSNPECRFHHLKVNLTHEEFLANVDRHWTDPRPFPASIFVGEAAALTRRRLAAITERDFLPHEAWAVNDPRHCRLLPLWQDVFEDVRVMCHFVHVLRSPIAVAASLAAWSGLPFEHSLLLWLRHNLEGEAGTRGRPRVWVLFERLVEKSADTIVALLDGIGLGELPRRRLQAALEAIDRSLVYHRAAERGHETTSSDLPWLSDAWKGLSLLGDGREGDGQAMLDAVRADLARHDRLMLEPLLGLVRRLREPAEDTSRQALVARENDRLLGENRRLAEEVGRLQSDLVEARQSRDTSGKLLAKSLDYLAMLDKERHACKTEVERLRHEVAARDHQVERLRHEVAARDHQVAALLNSTSWRVTRPLRAAKRLVFGEPR